MRHLFLTTLLLTACPPAEKEETGAFDSSDADTDTDTDVDTEVEVETGFDSDPPTDTAAPRPFRMVGLGFTGSCADGLCVYEIMTRGEAGVLELDITETGDSDLYTEYHTGFALDRVEADGSYVYRIDLAYVLTAEDVILNETTLFNEEVDELLFNRTTWYFGATSADGTEFDCRVTGDDPGYYTDWCTTVVR